jgi:hypothetical protein
VEKIKSVEDMVVWQKSMDLIVDVYRICRESELSRDWGLRR